jgi:hypothetical protein
MNNWMFDYHYAWLIRLVGLVLLLCMWFVLQRLGRQLWHTGSRLVRHLLQGIPICRHQKP